MSFYTTGLTDLDAAPREPTADELDAIERRTPIDLRLKAALSRIPVQVQRQGLPIAVIQAQVKGAKKGSQAHVGDLARALTRAGWTSRRHWERRGTGETVTLWYPRGVDPHQASIAARMKLPPGRPPKWLAHARKLARESGLVF